MVAILRDGEVYQTGDDKRYWAGDIQSLAPGELPALAAQRQNIAGQNADVKQRHHRHGQQHHVEYGRRGRHQRRDNGDDQDGVAALGNQELWRDDAQQGEEEDDDRHLEHQRHAQDHVDKQIEIIFDRYNRADVDTLSDAQQKLQAVTERHEVGETSAEYKQTRSADDERGRPAPFLLVETRGDKTPDLVQNPGRGDEDGSQDRQLDPDDVENIHRRQLHQSRRIDFQPF